MFVNLIKLSCLYLFLAFNWNISAGVTKINLYAIVPWITKDNLVATLPSWGNHFDISLELWIESYTSTNIYGWSEILRFTSTNQNCCSAGDRIPAIFANKNGYIYVVSQVGTNANAYKNVKIKTKTWTKVEIKQYQENGQVDISFSNILTI